MQILINALHRIAPLSPELQAHLRTLIETRTFGKKTHLVKPGRPCSHLYYIEQGIVGQFGERGDELLCCGFLKESDVLLPLEHSPVVTALEPTTVHSISLDDVLWMQAHFPAFNAHTRELVLRHYLSMQEMQHAFHHRSPLEKYKWMLQHAPDLVLRVSHTHLASYMGMSLETLSRVKGRL